MLRVRALQKGIEKQNRYCPECVHIAARKIRGKALAHESRDITE